jgi:hypothetical protein
MSLFNSSRGFAGLGSAAPKPLDPAADIARLLNQHAHHWQTLGGWRRRRRRPADAVDVARPPTLSNKRCPLHSALLFAPTAEKEIKEVKTKQEAAQGAYATAVEGKQAALSQVFTAERELAGTEADCLQRRAELDSSQVRGGGHLGD